MIARAGEDPTPDNLVAAAEVLERDNRKPPKEPKRLRTFLRGMGGLKDDGGVIKQILDVGAGRPDRMLNNRSGMDPDIARVKAWEEGYFYGEEPPELGEFIDAISDDIGDHSPRYRLDDLQAVDEWQAWSERQRELDRDNDIPFSIGKPPASGGASAPDIRAAAVAAFGKGADRIFAIAPAPKNAPENAVAFTNKKTGKVTLIEGRVSGDQVAGVLLHEVGAHTGIEKMIGRDAWTSLLADVEARAAAGEGAWAGVLDSIPADTPAGLRTEEALGYFLERNADLVTKEPWWKQLVNAIRDWASKALPWLKRKLSDAEIVDLARGAIAARMSGEIREGYRFFKSADFDGPTPAGHADLFHETRHGAPQKILADGYDVRKGGAADSDPLMPIGVFAKATDGHIGRGGQQMRLRAKLGNNRSFADRDALQAFLATDGQWRELMDAGDDAGARSRATQILAEAGVDSITVKRDAGGGGQEIETTVILDPAHVRFMEEAPDTEIAFSATGRQQPAPAGTPASNPKQPQPGQSQAPAGPPSPELARARFIAALTKRAQNRLSKEWGNFRNGSGERDAGEFLQAVLDFAGQGSGLTRSVDGLRKTIIARSLAEIEAATYHFRAGTLGRRVNKMDVDNFVKEMFGEDTKDAAAKAFAKAVSPALDKLRQRFNRAGGQIGKLDNWGLPQAHNVLALRNFVKRNGGKVAGRAALKRRLYDSLDPSRMRDVHTGKPLSAQEVWDALDTVIPDMLTDGWATRAPSRQAVTPGMLASRRADHRFLIFKDATTWLDWQKKFGSGDPITAMVSHVERMAKDIAALEVLGPNPETTIEWLKQKALHEGGQAAIGAPAHLPKRVVSRKDPGGYVAGKIKRMDDMWENYTGAVNVPVNGWFARRSASIRNLLTSAVLGRAILSALPTDPVLQAFARQFAGTSHGRAIELMIRNIKDPRQANQMALIMDHALQAFGDDARQAREFSSWGVSSVFATQVLAMSGLTPWTRLGRKTFGMGFLADMGNMAGDDWGKLDPIFKRTFTRYGLGAQEWDVIRASQLTPEGFVTPRAVEDLGGADIADRMLHMILQETEYAVPSGTLRSRSFMRGRDQAGTLWGEARQSARMFLSFGATLPMLYGYRLAHQLNGGRAAQGALYAAALVGTLTVGGYVANQLSNLTDYKDLQSPLDASQPLGLEWRTVQAAFLRGGGLGVYGDFLFSNLNRMQRPLGETMAGAEIGFLSDVQKATLGEIAKGEKGDVVTAVTQLMLQNTPGSSLWYFKGAWDRWFEDGFRRLTSPTADETIRRRAQTLKRETGQGQFWRSGQLLPERAPEFVTPPPRPVEQ